MDGSQKSPRILIGDDSEILSNMLRDVFEEHGFEVVQAFDGFECKSAFLKERPDIAFVDIRMPGADGIEVLQFIRSKQSQIPVVMMTGLTGSEETAVKAMKMGADDYLIKPFDTDQVVQLANRLLETREAEKETAKLRKEVRRTERQLAHLTKIISEAIISTDSRGRIEFVNRAACKMWGYSAEELNGQDIHFLIRGESRTLLYRDLVRDTVRKGRVEGEFHFRRKDKSTFPGYLSTSVIKEDTRVRGIVAVVADLTRLYEVESRLRQTEKLASLGKVVEGVAHEVRNCLTSLGGFTRRVRKITLDDPDCNRFTRIILEDVGRLENMVREIEEYVRFSKFYSFNFREIDIHEPLERAHERVRSHLSEEVFKSVAFVMRADKKLSRITADSNALEEVFFNLFLNAYEAMPSGGKLTVRVEDRNSGIGVIVSDTGVGMPKKDLTEIFTPFFTSKTSGAGMGLSKVYLLVDEHRGNVQVTSEPKKGSTFEVFLPRERLLSGLGSLGAASTVGPVK